MKSAVIVTYSFDPDVVVYLTHDEDSAIEKMRSLFSDELRIMQNEGLNPVKAEIDDTHATIMTDGGTMEYLIGRVVG